MEARAVFSSCPEKLYLRHGYIFVQIKLYDFVLYRNVNYRPAGSKPNVMICAEVGLEHSAEIYI